MLLPKLVFTLVVELIGQRRISRVYLTALSDPLLSSFSQLILQQDHILGIALVSRIRQVTDERDETNDEVDDDVQLHLGTCARFEGRFDLAAGAEYHQGKEHVCHVSNGWDEPNDAAPSES